MVEYLFCLAFITTPYTKFKQGERGPKSTKNTVFARVSSPVALVLYTPGTDFAKGPPL